MYLIILLLFNIRSFRNQFTPSAVLFLWCTAVTRRRRPRLVDKFQIRSWRADRKGRHLHTLKLDKYCLCRRIRHIRSFRRRGGSARWLAACCRVRHSMKCDFAEMINLCNLAREFQAKGLPQRFDKSLLLPFPFPRATRRDKFKQNVSHVEGSGPSQGSIYP
jgi:hypothetical protein